MMASCSSSSRVEENRIYCNTVGRVFSHGRRTSYSEERVTLRHCGHRITWRVEKGSSLIPVQKKHTHTHTGTKSMFLNCVNRLCPDIFLYIPVTAADLSYSTRSYSSLCYFT